VALRMSQVLDGASFAGRPVDENELRSLTAQGRSLLAEAAALANG
jgi:hypothetical protein